MFCLECEAIESSQGGVRCALGCLIPTLKTGSAPGCSYGSPHAPLSLPGLGYGYRNRNGQASEIREVKFIFFGGCVGTGRKERMKDDRAVHWEMNLDQRTGMGRKQSLLWMCDLKTSEGSVPETGWKLPDGQPCVPSPDTHVPKSAVTDRCPCSCCWPVSIPPSPQDHSCHSCRNGAERLAFSGVGLLCSTAPFSPLFGSEESILFPNRLLWEVHMLLCPCLVCSGLL